MKKSFITILLVFVAVLGLAQEQNFIHNRAIMERIPTAGAVGNAIALGNLSYSPTATVGDVYLNEDYRNATFWLYDNNQIAQGLAARLDLQRNEFDINLGSGKGIRALPGSKVRTMVWIDNFTNTPQYFVNGGEYKNDEGTPYYGFFQILAEGEVTLLKLNRVIFKPADRNPTHSTGSKDNQLLKRFELYYALGNKALELPNKKGIRKLFASRQEEIDKFIKLNELNLGTEPHIVILFDYYNSLIKK